jgi:hypothetical protein
VEEDDVTAPDPDFLLSLKQYLGLRWCHITGDANVSTFKESEALKNNHFNSLILL